MQINDNDEHDDISFMYVTRPILCPIGVVIILIVSFASTPPHRSVPSNLAYSFLSTSHYRFLEDNPSPIAICLEHDHELLSPHLTSTWMPNGIGSVPGKNFIFAETQVM